MIKVKCCNMYGTAVAVLYNSVHLSCYSAFTSDECETDMNFIQANVLVHDFP